jgi:predicted regulator of Ras-like GTPase activity (Roadblock/LC7/MglB family)
MADEIRRLSDELARDPSSLVFLQLGEALRRGGQLDLAHRIATRGAERHAADPDARDLLARICVDRGELEQACEEWAAVLHLAPSHLGARKGLGYVLFKQGKLEEAEQHLRAAAEHDDADATISTALRMVRRLLQHAPDAAVVDEARRLFAEILADGEHTALLIDADGLVTAGAYVTAEGRDVAQEVGAELSGVRDEAQRATRHLGLGPWSSVVFETEVATVAMSPVVENALVLVAASRTIPLGFVRRVLDRCARRATSWLEEAP